MVDNTVKDVSRSIARLDEHALVDAGDVVDVDGTNWTGEDLRISVAQNLAFTVGQEVKLFKVTKRDVSLMLAAHGASTLTIRQHAGAIARFMRSDLANHRWSGWI